MGVPPAQARRVQVRGVRVAVADLAAGETASAARSAHQRLVGGALLRRRPVTIAAIVRVARVPALRPDGATRDRIQVSTVRQQAGPTEGAPLLTEPILVDLSATLHPVGAPCATSSDPAVRALADRKAAVHLLDAPTEVLLAGLASR